MLLRPFNMKIMNGLIIYDSISKFASIFKLCRDSYYMLPSVLYWGATLCVSVPLVVAFFTKHTEEYPKTNRSHPTVTCPYCKSTNCKRITATAKAVNIALFGIFGNKRRYQWHCNDCKSDF